MSLTSRIALRLGVVFAGLLGLALLLAVAGFYIARLVYLPQLPSMEAVRELPLQVPLRIFSADGKLMGEFGVERREPLAYAELPQPLIEAFIAAEDARFFEHPGVDLRGLMRAAINLALTGERTQGGSTITMQLARNYFLSRERTYDRKIREIFLALRMEEVLSKQEILESYLNKIYLGERAYGVGAAAKIYFGVPVDELSLSQVAVLAGLPKAPSRDNPVNNPERARQRRNYVLSRMAEIGSIGNAEYEAALAEPVVATPATVSVETEAHYAAELARMELVERFGEAVYESGYRVTTTIDSRQQDAAVLAVQRNLRALRARTGYSIRRPTVDAALLPQLETEPAPPQLIEALTTRQPQLAALTRAVVVNHDAEGMRLRLEDGRFVDLPPEAYAWARFGDQRMARGSLVYAEKGSGDWELAAEPSAQAALVAVASDSGAITAMVGGYDYFAGRFNRAVQAERQPGSAFKPIVYAAALEQGKTPATVIIDAPIVMEDYSLEGEWRPRNYSGKFYGPTRLREAIVHSRNIVSIKLMRSIGIEAARAFAGRLGLPLERIPQNLSVALGSPVFTPLEMATAFAAFANGGHRIAPYLIAEIRADDGTLVEAHEPPPLCPPAPDPLDAGWHRETAESRQDEDCAPQVMDPRTAWLISDMMRDVVRRGTGARARVLGRDDIAGKTGTTNDETDAWFVGFQPTLTAAVWVGHDQPRRLGRGEGGSRAALPMWIDFMRVALDGVPQQFLLRPDGITEVRIDPDTGLLMPPDAPGGVFELVQEEHVPRYATTAETGDSGGSALDLLY